MSKKYSEFASPANFTDLIQPAKNLSSPESTGRFNYHARKITFEPFFRAMVIFSLTPSQTLTSLKESAAKDPLFELHNAKIEVSVPALSQANATRPLHPFIEILSQLMVAVDQMPAESKALREINSDTLSSIKDLLVKTHMFDSTTFHMPPKVAEWARWGRENRGGVKVHLKLASGYGGLEKVVISPSKDNDGRYFKTLLELEKGAGAIYIYDCGYNKIETFDEITESGNFLVSKLHGAVTYSIKEEENLGDKPTPCGYILHKKMIVNLGSEHSKKVSRNLYMLLEVTDTRGDRVILVTNMLSLEPEKVCALYMYRWTIEICFRWLKHTLRVIKFISYSPNGVMLQLLMALIIYALLAIYQQGKKRFGLAHLMNQITIDLHQAIFRYGYEQGLRATSEEGGGIRAV